ncbi:hypothetical protein [Endozoicomonas sp.]|uniref:hypothetical protein n=1 Tax=Endozoicomonas sp. TaxID=1892382 RepID=UPI00383AB713
MNRVLTIRMTCLLLLLLLLMVVLSLSTVSAYGLSKDQPTTGLQGFLVTSKDGREVIEAVTGEGQSQATADQLPKTVPGSTLEYRVTFTNPTKKSLSGANIQAVIPEGTRYLEKSATSKTAGKLEYSIDGGRSWGQAPIKRMRKNKEGQSVLAVVPASEYTHLRWQPGMIKSGTMHVFKYRVQVN